MSFRVEDSDFVYCDLEDIVRSIRKHNPNAAAQFIRSFNESVDQLSESPHIGRTRSDLGANETRSWRFEASEILDFLRSRLGLHSYLARSLRGTRSEEGIGKVRERPATRADFSVGRIMNEPPVRGGCAIRVGYHA
jgi:plasmid stabilization system protein ParE